ncbi:MAG: acetyl-CoA carboxylase, carboxyltransferase subunit beta [Pseudomonadota bacterium]
MNWFTNLRPKLGIWSKKEAPDNLWHSCSNCGQMIFYKEFAAALNVCGECGFHDRIRAVARYDSLFGEGSYEIIPMPQIVDDPLKFRDQKRYGDRLRDARAKTGVEDAFSAVTGDLGGLKVVVGVQDFAFMAGSMGIAVGDGFITAATYALEHKRPFIVFTAAGGARMQEGILSLMQMPRTTVAINRLRDAGIPYIVVLTDPTTGGVTASYAMLGDVHLAEPGALIGFAGPRVIQNTIREKLPEGFQRAEYLRDHGMVDQVVPRRELKDRLILILSLITNTRDGVPKERIKRLEPPRPDEAEEEPGLEERDALVEGDGDPNREEAETSEEAS